MILGVLKEASTENRVSLVPAIVQQLVQSKVTVWVEKGAGSNAWLPDEAYEQAGAVIQNRETILQQATVLLCIQPLSEQESGNLNPSTVLLGVYQPLFQTAKMKQWAQRQLTVFSLDNIPRTTRAQSMDVLSSQANIAGYKAILLAANSYSRYFPMFMTAAGSIAPAKVLILGAGVAGLQAIATARRLGAVVEVFDTRPAVKEEVMSLGAKFVDVEGAADASSAGGYAVEQTADYQAKQAAAIGEAAKKADIIITTAQIPGKKAPILITREMMDMMKPGSLIVDIAAATGGNTDISKDQQTVTYKGVTVIGDSNLPSKMPADASKLYAKNVLNFLQLIIDKEGQLSLNFEDDIVQGACIAKGGQIVNERLLQAITAAV
ncbi:NAD(P)(+) transhydrogenase (Re/Si-specific) subunit alpha [Chitinophaga caeni]|uniref:NAD(P) transhydrogenase subunit alpha part 1 n=1 Tax=Chitinophaga caeni TaxID=2029983 RepID=A0A291QV21_9BACT|nr:Re/Si-specific NAD(P)(+) transhydrogenase subunit alpha [Chitinophaga caeni]ATL47694.1 NAD(P)(+) transhydrogenase (Re/Si-specific) subunit alpha [Chitinophaga caeni]